MFIGTNIRKLNWNKSSIYITDKEYFNFKHRSTNQYDETSTMVDRWRANVVLQMSQDSIFYARLTAHSGLTGAIHKLGMATT